jgi:SAM-dependent methyltransferase
MHGYPEGVELEAVSCPLGCAPADEQWVEGCDRLHDIPGQFTVLCCKRCGLKRTSPRPTAQTIGAYYPADYGPYRAPEAAPPRPLRGVKGWLVEVLGLNARALPPVAPGRMLEIGCASGAYMETARLQGWAVQGIEYSDAAADVARARGFAVETGSVETARGPAEPVDLVAAWMVIEHLHDPIAALKKIRRWVRPDGYLIASVPDSGGWLMSLFGTYRYDLHLPNHLFHFTPQTLARIFAECGWRVERVFWQRNCNSVLRSAEYWAQGRGHRGMAGALRWLQESGRLGKVRLALSWLLGVTRQSGRIEVWARPSRGG